MPGTRVEVALDRGEAHAGGQAPSRVCEVEIELLEGDRAAAFDLARALVDTVPLRPSAVTKAQRGYRLFRGEAMRPAKARARRARRRGPDGRRCGARRDRRRRARPAAGERGRRARHAPIPSSCTRRASALRRMRSALRIFRDVLPADAQRWRERAALASRAALGEARDWDVFATETLPPLAQGLRQREASTRHARAARRRPAPARARRGARGAALRALRAPHARHLALARDDAARGAARARARRSRTSPRALVRKRHKRLLADATAPRRARRAEERHALRIDAKRLRYAVDGFASLFKGKRVAGLPRARSPSIQDRAGRGQRRGHRRRACSRELSPPRGASTASRAAGSPRAPKAIRRRLDALAHRLGEAKRFWRKKPQPAKGALMFESAEIGHKLSKGNATSARSRSCARRCSTRSTSSSRSRSSRCCSSWAAWTARARARP